MVLARLVFYVGGLVFAAGLMFWFVRLHGPMAKYLAASYAAWALACLTFFSTLLNKCVTGEPLATWGEYLFTVNAFVMFLAPLALAAWVIRDRANGHS